MSENPISIITTTLASRAYDNENLIDAYTNIVKECEIL
jgi:hypothetical protein